MSSRGTSIVIANHIKSVWKMARVAADSLSHFESIPDEIQLVQNFMRTEVSADFELIELLKKGVGVHHAGLSDDIRALMEWLAEAGLLRILCATSTIAQGINFPVSSVFLASRFVPQGQSSVEMGAREFWNLAGRAGRIGQDSVGVVGIAQGTSRSDVISFVSQSTGALVSRLVTLLNELADKGELNSLSDVLWKDQWEDFRSYIAHLWAEKGELDAVLAEADELLRQTYGYTTLRNSLDQQDKADALLDATRKYVEKLAQMPAGTAQLADSTGFSPEGVTKALREMGQLENKLTTEDWRPESLFGEGGNMAALFGVMLKVPELKRNLDAIGGEGMDHSRISKITRDWVNGVSLENIATEYFKDATHESLTPALTDACKAIYRSIVYTGTWGVAALSGMSSIDFDDLSDADRRKIKSLPSMIYHGVNSEDAVLMRMNSVPRSAADALGKLYSHDHSDSSDRYSVSKARRYLKQLDAAHWEVASANTQSMSGGDLRRVWEVLSGETVSAS